MTEALRGETKIDLAKLGAEFLQFTCRTSLPDTVMAQLQLLAPADKNGEFVFEDTYTASEKQHHAIGTILRRQAPKDVRIEFLYHTFKGRYVPERTRPSTERLLDCLAQIQTEFELNCLAQFDLGTAKSTIVALPIRILNGASAPFTEIRGLRLAKVVDGKQVYSVVLDQPSAKAAAATVDFKLVDRFSPLLPGSLLNHAKSIADAFVAT